MKGEGVYANVQCLKSSENREASRSRAVIQIPFTMNLVQKLKTVPHSAFSNKPDENLCKQNYQSYLKLQKCLKLS